MAGLPYTLNTEIIAYRKCARSMGFRFRKNRAANAISGLRGTCGGRTCISGVTSHLLDLRDSGCTVRIAGAFENAELPPLKNLRRAPKALPSQCTSALTFSPDFRRAFDFSRMLRIYRAPTGAPVDRLQCDGAREKEDGERKLAISRSFKELPIAAGGQTCSVSVLRQGVRCRGRLPWNYRKWPTDDKCGRFDSR